MKIGDTVFVIHHSLNIFSGVLGSEITAQGFYTRWGAGHIVYLRTAGIQAKEVSYNNENIFNTKREATKEVFTRRLRYPTLMRGRAA